MPRRGENIYKRKDGRWEGRFIKGHDIKGKALYGYVYGRTYSDVKQSLKNNQNKILNLESTTTKSSVSYESILVSRLESQRLNIKESTYARYHQIV